MHYFCSAFKKAKMATNRTFTMIKPDAVEDGHIGAILEKITGHKVKKNYDRSKPKGVNSRSSDNTLVKKVLNWSPKISTEEGMARLFEYVNSEYHKKK